MLRKNLNKGSIDMVHRFSRLEDSQATPGVLPLGVEVQAPNPYFCGPLVDLFVEDPVDHPVEAENTAWLAV
jgi:hypothetical protein